MCGIAGYLCRSAGDSAPLALVEAMARRLDHRGPDARAARADGPVALGHARLAILDLRPEANQPLLSDDGQLAIVFNGEIYNFQELARRWNLQPRTRCDTEVILLLYRKLGLDCLRELRGMFALAIWDRPRQRLLLARDRIGKKPLFVHSGPRGVSFASEVRALLEDPDLKPEVDLQAMHLFMSLGFVPHHTSVFRGVQKVAPGSYVLLEHDSAEGLRRREGRYWRLTYREPDGRSPQDLARELRERVSEAVRLRMISDVPLGAFLSGGVDSSSVVALMTRHSSQPVKTFSIGFEDYEKSELEYARLVAARYETDHHEEVVSPDAAELLPVLVEQYGEPFADPSAIPTYCLARMTRQHVTVALAGDGADEVFGGYTRYAHERLARIYGRLPRPLAGPLAAALSRLPTRRSGRFWELMALIRERAELIQLPPETRYVSQYGNLYTPLLRELYARPMQEAALSDAEAFVGRLMRESSARNPVDRLLEVDINGYLVDNIFVKVDIASMAHSLEVRSPLVDQEVVELAEELPPALKLWGFRGKRILRMAMADLVPARIMHRPKQGFGIPHARWLRGDLRSMARDVLLSPRAIGRGYFEPAPLRRLLDDHDSGLVDHGLRIWNLLWLELWHRRFIDGGAASTA